MPVDKHNSFLFLVFVFGCLLTSFSQTIDSEFSDYCDGDSIDLILNYDN